MDPVPTAGPTDSAVLVVRLWMEDGQDPHLRVRVLAAFDGPHGLVTTVVADGRDAALVAVDRLLAEFHRRWRAGHSAD